MFTGSAKELTDLSRQFTEPANATHRQYEALRAYFVEGLSGVEAARRLGYIPRSFRVLVAVAMKVNCDLQLTLMASRFDRLLACRISRGYEQAKSRHLFRDFIDASAGVTITARGSGEVPEARPQPVAGRRRVRQDGHRGPV